MRYVIFPLIAPYVHLLETFRELQQAELLKKAPHLLPLPEMNPQVAELLKAVKKWESGKTVIFVDEKD